MASGTSTAGRRLKQGAISLGWALAGVLIYRLLTYLKNFPYKILFSFDIVDGFILGIGLTKVNIKPNFDFTIRINP